MRRFFRAVFPVLTLVGAMAPARAQPAPSAAADALERGFQSPPDSAKPRTWWHWTMSNVAKAGITKDLEWMKRVGIGGFMLADVNQGRGQDVEPKIPFGTAEWFDAVRFAAAEADRLGLEMAIFSSPGWSETGGPWVKPEQAMKKLVWSETSVAGGKRFSGKLVAPPNTIGQIRNTGASYYTSDSKDAPLYADSAVIAYRTPAGEGEAIDAHPAVTTNNGPIDGTPLLDDQLNTLATIPAPKEGGAAWVQYEFPQPFFARAITLGGRGGSANGIPVGRVLASDDGKNFHTLVTLPGTQLYRQGMVRTYAFPPTTAKFYRIEMTGAPIGPAPTMSQTPTAPAAQYVLSEAVLHRGARVHRWEEKAGFSFLFEYETVPSPDVPAETTVAPREVIDLTARMQPDGTLDWDAPPGNWTVLRLGYSLTGAKNRPATAAGSGYEADKLSRKHMEAYYHGYFDPLQKALGPLFGKSLRYVMMDSWEAGTNNWTDEMMAEFRRRRGYDPTPYLPALTGRIVDTADTSDRFLWDFRRTLADLWADAHYGVMAEKLREHGIGIYAEAAGVSLEMPEDTLLNKSKVEIPMGEFWVRDLHPRLMYFQDVRGAASAAHVYGKPLVATESFTGGGYESPYTLKKVADYWLAQGVNRIVFHTSAHQPLDTKPGNTMVGTHLNRNITWAEQAAPFMTYLARQCFMLQQGQFVADIAYLLNEGAPSTPPIWASGTQPAPPEGFDYDFINADVLLNRMTVNAEGRLALPDGMSYRVLVLPETDRMRPELLKKIGELARGGAIVVGRRPLRSPSLAGYPQADADVHAQAEEIWGDLDGASRTIRRVGKGAVYWGWPVERVMAQEKIAKDFEYARGLGNDLAWLHRRTAEAEIYYVANLSDAPFDGPVRLRGKGGDPRLWHPDSGAIEPIGGATVKDYTEVLLRLAERESGFIVLRRGVETSRGWAQPTQVVLAEIAGPWTVRFAENLGAPASQTLARLASWTAQAEEGVKYFSGTASYTTTLQAPASWFREAKPVVIDNDSAGASPRLPALRAPLSLDLGKVGDIAEVLLNGKSVGLAWKAPYRLDITNALQPGENRLEIKVTNQWTNRLLGDRAAPADKKVLNSTVTLGGIGGGAAIPLPESGLLGPVKIVLQTTQVVELKRLPAP